jgi:hypothetical protein
LRTSIIEVYHDNEDDDWVDLLSSRDDDEDDDWGDLLSSRDDAAKY